MADDRDTSRGPGTREFHRLLVAASDPEAQEPADGMRAMSAVAGAELLALADAHGVLPAVLARLRDALGEEQFASAQASAASRWREANALTGMLSRYADRILAGAGGLAVALVKGRAFAEHLYPRKSLRTFTDIDLLAAPSATGPLSEVLSASGFRFADWDHDPVRLEVKWVHAENQALVVEVHTNLVHHPDLRRTISFAHEDLEGEPNSSATHLTIALVHGALHQYERLRQVVDILQGARKLRPGAEEADFERLIARTGARLAAVVGLDLAGRMFAEPRCREIARAMGSVRWAGPGRMLIGPGAALSTMGSARRLHSWRRKAFRALLKK